MPRSLSPRNSSSVKYPASTKVEPGSIPPIPTTATSQAAPSARVSPMPGMATSSARLRDDRAIAGAARCKHSAASFSARSAHTWFECSWVWALPMPPTSGTTFLQRKARRGVRASRRELRSPAVLARCDHDGLAEPVSVLQGYLQRYEIVGGLGDLYLYEAPLPPLAYEL